MVFTFPLLFVFGIGFRVSTKDSRLGWMIWAVPLLLQGLLRIGGVTEGDGILILFLLTFAAGALFSGIGMQIHRFITRLKR